MRRSRGRAHPRRGPGIAGAAAIIAAAGTGVRARDETSSVPKQFRLLAGRPLLTWAAQVVESCSPLIVAAPSDDLERVRELLPGATVVAGGDTRQRSVRNALELVDADRVVVHDAARPLASSRLVELTLSALTEADGAVPGVPLEDTIKVVEGDRVKGTIDRTRIWRVQTPQAFRTESLRKAHDRALGEDFTATDDAQLLERYGMRVVMVQGETRNLKITSGADFAVAAALTDLP